MYICVCSVHACIFMFVCVFVDRFVNVYCVKGVCALHITVMCMCKSCVCYACICVCVCVMCVHVVCMSAYLYLCVS